MLEHLLPGGTIEIDQFGHAHAARQSGGDDRAGARSRDVVEIFAELLARSPGHQRLDLLEDPQRQQTAYAAAIQGQHPAWPVFFVPAAQTLPAFGIVQRRFPLDLSLKPPSPFCGTLKGRKDA